MTLPPRLLNAYRRTRYSVEQIEVTINRRSMPIDDIVDRLSRARAAVFVTAWNPRSHRMPAGWNQRMQAILKQRLRRFRTLPAEGAWRRW